MSFLITVELYHAAHIHEYVVKVSIKASLKCGREYLMIFCCRKYIPKAVQLPEMKC